MIACIDVAYVESSNPIAVAACLVFESWDSATVVDQHIAQVDDVAEYVPGQFYKRELPSVTKVLASISQPLDIVIVDGYVQLGTDRAGLGQILHAQVNQDPKANPTIVVGVAKKSYADNDLAVEVFRGGSIRPLFVTALGMPISEAAERIKKMHGEFRLPTLLKQVDSLVREKAALLS